MESWRPDELQLALVYDTRAAALPPGVRAVLRAERHLLMAAEGYEVGVELGVDRRQGGISLNGQVLVAGEPAENAAVLLRGDPAPVRTDIDGWFTIRRLTAPTCELTVVMASRVLRLPPIALDEGRR